LLCAETQRRDLEVSDNAGFTSGEDAVPETPPPSYTSITRQTSYTSNITQSSLQRMSSARLFRLLSLSVYFMGSLDLQ